MRKLEINIPIFDQMIVVLQAEEMSSVDKYVEDVYDIKLGAGPAECRKASTYRLPNEIIIGLLLDSTERTIVHECGHATFELLDILGINPTIDQETFCYIQDYLFDKIVTWFKHD